MFGERLNRARRLRGLSLRGLSAKVGVSATMLSKYERGKSMPSWVVLTSLARALGIRVGYLFRRSIDGLDRIEYRNRHNQAVPDRVHSRVMADVCNQLERWRMLDSLVPAPWPSEFCSPSDLPQDVETFEDVELIAIKVREAWHLGWGPIPNLIESLESNGIIVLTTPFDANRFDGMSARLGDWKIAVVGASWPGDRQRFTLAHELGHLVLDERLSESIDKEGACDRFAGAFLVPALAVRQSVGERRQSLQAYELYLLKHTFGLSMAGWSHRARDLGIVSEAEYRRFRRLLTKKQWDKTEPWEQYPSEQPCLFERIVHRALSEDLIGESMAAELLEMPQSTLAAQRRMEYSIAKISS